MGRDFAQREGGGRQARGRNELPGWLWGLVGLAIGVGVSAYFYISKPRPLEARVDDARADARSEKKKIELPPKEPARFSFYEILPSYEVVIPRDKATVPGKPAAIAEPGSYIIQVGSFRERGQADEQKAQLALLGIEARLEKVTIDNAQTWYRVRVGPERDLAKVHSMMSRLAESNIQSFLVKVQG